MSRNGFLGFRGAHLDILFAFCSLFYCFGADCGAGRSRKPKPTAWGDALLEKPIRKQVYFMFSLFENRAASMKNSDSALIKSADNSNVLFEDTKYRIESSSRICFRITISIESYLYSLFIV